MIHLMEFQSRHLWTFYPAMKIDTLMELLSSYENRYPKVIEAQRKIL